MRSFGKNFLGNVTKGMAVLGISFLAFSSACTSTPTTGQGMGGTADSTGITTPSTLDTTRTLPADTTRR